MPISAHLHSRRAACWRQGWDTYVSWDTAFTIFVWRFACLHFQEGSLLAAGREGAGSGGWPQLSTLIRRPGAPSSSDKDGQPGQRKEHLSPSGLPTAEPLWSAHSLDAALDRLLSQVRLAKKIMKGNWLAVFGAAVVCTQPGCCTGPPAQPDQAWERKYKHHFDICMEGILACNF
eukprot:1156244-Pelagomonas_calceolata.AAC.5